MKRYIDNIHNEKTKELLPLNALFSEKVTFEFDTFLLPNKQDAAFSTSFHNNSFDTIPFNKHISRCINKEIIPTHG